MSVGDGMMRVEGLGMRLSCGLIGGVWGRNACAGCAARGYASNNNAVCV